MNFTAMHANKDYSMRVNIFVVQHLFYMSFFRYVFLRPLMAGIRIREVVKKPHVVKTVEELESATLEEEKSACELVTA
jgi:hypothetical protein